MSVATPRVLVVSESRITRRVIEMTFADQPLQLAVFADGTAASDDWQARPPAALIADIAMQAPDGYALAAMLREQPAGEKACVILLAGQADVVDEAAVAAVRASAVLRKPLDSHQLIDALRQALRAGPPAAVEAAIVGAAVEAQVQVAVAAGGGGVAVADAIPPDAGAATGDAPIAAAGVALLIGRESPLAGEHGIGAWVQGAGGRPDDGLAETFEAMLEGEAAPAAAPSRALSDADVDRVAMRVAAVVATGEALRGRLDAALTAQVSAAVGPAAEVTVAQLAREVVAAAADRVVREVAPALVTAIAHAAVREEIARLRAARVA